MAPTKEEILARLTTGTQQARDAMAAALGKKDPQAIADAFSAHATKRVPVDAITVRGLLYARRSWGGIVQKANAARANADSSAVALACQTLYDISTTGQTVPMDVDPIHDAVSADLALMVAANLVDADDEAAVLALCEAPYTMTEYDARCALWDAQGNWLGG